MLSEARIAHELSGLRHGGPRGEDTPADAPAPSTSGFIHCHAVGVCHGEYAPALLEAWDEFDERKGSENDRPGAFTAEQLYIVFAFADGGRDLVIVEKSDSVTYLASASTFASCTFPAH